ncbi:MAG: tetratricopeptide repeat protein [Acidobacteria bacterium]|nr:tetratricopeptide repeat protein [Acidobacteriota bacterium]
MTDAIGPRGDLMSAVRATLPSQAWQALSTGAWAAARRLCDAVLRQEPDHPEALHVKALALWGEGELSSAIQCLSRAADFEPNDASLLSDLGVLHIQEQDWQSALQCFHTCRQLQSDEPTVLQGQAEALFRLGRFAEATITAQEWVGLAPEDGAASRLLAHCLALEGRLDEAFEAGERNLREDPASESTLALLEALCQKRRHFELALSYAQTASRLHPSSAETAARLAAAYWNVGDCQGAQAARATALRLGVTDPELIASLDWLSLHDPEQTAASLLEGHRTSVAAMCRPHREAPPAANTADPGKRLRVGYLSGEFVSNAAYWFLLPWLRCHDSGQVETVYYMTRPQCDRATEQYRAIADHWREVSSLTDEALADRIREDGIDILVDLSGHFGSNRLSVFSRRPAPVQMSYPNYPGTTGLAAIDYIFTDIWTTPPGCEPEYAEKPYRLPSGCLVYGAPGGECETSPLPVETNGYVTFGLFQRPGKLHPGVWDVIAATIRQVPDSRLLIHFASADLDDPDSPQIARLLAELTARGVAAQRVMFRGARPVPAHLITVAEADIALDTFPYNGQTTTCDCLWMGVPVVGLRGHSHVARVTPALLDRMGLGHLAATTTHDYVRTAVELASNRRALAQLRASLRARMHANGLTSGENLAREIEAAYREVWRLWCDSERERKDA